ncbi:MAG: hypothetical protein M3N93_13260 [Acidobacteriota bacterium]|nr:hypothetical protein [Acidobacteriota bacterium]
MTPTEKLSPPAQLPPLILHPFSGGAGTDDLLAGSLASLALQGLVASPDDPSDLMRTMLAGRYQEIRMLLFLGKDIFRWLQQCVEQVAHSSALDRDPGVIEQSFAAMAVESPPEAVKEKLERWGVTDRRSIFSRAIGIHSLFAEPPPAQSLSPIFLRNYHRYADYAYICYLHSTEFKKIDAADFPFELYASGEYSRMLAAGWNLG